MKSIVIKTFEKELLAENIIALKPLERVDLSEGVALPDEARQVVACRKGSILSASTILKSDFFSNLQKMSLPEYVFVINLLDVGRLIEIHADALTAPLTSVGCH